MRVHLWAVVDDGAAAQVPAQHAEVLEVVALHHHAAVPVDAVADEGALRVQDVEQLLSIHLGEGGSAGGAVHTQQDVRTTASSAGAGGAVYAMHEVGTTALSA